jgi:hypothetical protein
MPHSQWIFFESRRRTLVVFRLLALVANMSDAVPCVPLPRYAAMPLGMPEGLWGVRWDGDGGRGGDGDKDEDGKGKKWRGRVREVRCEEAVFGMTVKGQLRRVVAREGAGVRDEEAGWEEWCASAGVMGCLVRAVGMLLE